MRRNDWLIGQLPMGMMEDDFFVRFTSLFQELASTLLDGVDNIPNVVDPSVAPAPVVRWLGSWIGVNNIDSSLPVEMQRRIVREWGQFLAWRGTKRGLVAFLELMTGSDVQVSDSGGVFVAGEAGLRYPHVRMQVESTGWIPEDSFVAVVAAELPANVTFELWVRERRLWPLGWADSAVLPAAGLVTADGEVTASVAQEAPPAPDLDADEAVWRFGTADGGTGNGPAGHGGSPWAPGATGG